jgi:hypothetical protein
MKVGDRIKIRTEDGQKWWGRVTEERMQTDPVDVTVGGLFPGGPPPDTYRKTVPGLKSWTLTVEIEGPR